MTNSTRCTLLAKQACTTLSHVVQKITPPSANNFLKLFFALFAMLALGVGNAWAEEVTFNYADYKGNGTQSTGSSYTMEKSGMLSIGNNKFYGNTSYAHFYANGTITITPATGVTITKIVLTASGTSYNGYQDSGSITASTGTMSKEGTSVTWTGSASSAFTLKNNKQIRWTKIVVTYESQASQSYSVILDRNGEQETINNVASGTSLDDIDGNGEQGGCAEWSFVGWSKSQRSDQDDSTPMDLVTEVDGAGPYYAVYSHTADGGGGSTTKTMKSFTSISGNIDGDANVSYVAAKGNAGTAPAVNSNEIRIYQNGGTLTITGNNGKKLTSITIGSSMKTSVSYKIDGGTESSAQSITANGKYTLSDIDATTVLFTCKGTDKNSRLYLNYLSVTYSGGSTVYYTTTPDCGSTPDVIVKTLESIAVSDMTEEYVEGAEFTFDGTCTATYSVTKNGVPQEDETAEVTPTDITEPDMSTAGEKEITVTYTENEVTKTTTYNITVNPKPKYTITWNNAGTTNTTKVVQGEAFGTLPEKPADCDNGKKFMGWTSATEVNNDGSGIVYVKETDIPTSDMTYYAVFAVVEGGDGTPTTATQSIKTYAEANSWANESKHTEIPVDANITATVTGGGNTGKYYASGTNWRLYQTENATLTISAAEGFEIQMVKLTYTNSSDGILTLDGSNVASGTESEINAATVTFGVGNTGSATNGQVRISAIEVVYAPAAAKSDYSLDCELHQDPFLTVTENAIDFGTVAQNETVTKTFTVTGGYLAEDVALTISGTNASFFSVSPATITKADDVEETVTVTYNPTAIGDHTATLTIKSGEITKTVALSGTVLAPGKWVLVKNVTEIKAGDEIIIAAANADYAIGEATDNNYKGAAITKVGKTANADAGVTVLKVEATGDAEVPYAFKDGSKYLYAAGSDKNYLKAQVTNNVNGQWAVTITEGVASIVAAKSSNRKVMQYNPNNGSPIFACYASASQQALAIYRNSENDNKPSISVTPANKAFGVLTVGEKATQDIEITALNITQALTAELTGEGFTKSDDIVGNKITITFAPEEVKEYSAILTISAGTEASASVTLTGKGVAAAYSVTYDKNGAEGDAPTDGTKYVAGSNVTVAGQGDMTKAGYRFAGWKYDENIYKAGAKFTMPAENVTFVAQWEEKEDFSTGYWVLVTNESELQSDDYVVIAAADYDVAMKSYESGNNCKQVNITKVNDFLIWNENVGVFQLTKTSDLYTIQDVNTEQYLYAAGGTSNNYLRAADDIEMGPSAVLKYVWTISITDGKATIKAQIENNGENKARNTIMYNATEGINGQLFSCYASGQKDIALYKYQTTYTYTRPELPVGSYGTICLPYGSSNYIGAEFYEVAGKETGKVVLDQVTELEAGVPYIFKATANVLEVVYKGEAADASNKNGLYGTFTNNTPVDVGMYIVYDNQLRLCGTECIINANRAYLNLDEVDNGVPAQMPGRKRVGMAVTGENGTTDVDNIVTPNGKATKVLHNGQIIIIRNGEKFNAQGQKL